MSYSSGNRSHSSLTKGAVRHEQGRPGLGSITVGCGTRWWEHGREDHGILGRHIQMVSVNVPDMVSYLKKPDTRCVCCLYALLQYVLTLTGFGLTHQKFVY